MGHGDLCMRPAARLRREAVSGGRRKESPKLSCCKTQFLESVTLRLLAALRNEAIIGIA